MRWCGWADASTGRECFVSLAWSRLDGDGDTSHDSAAPEFVDTILEANDGEGAN